MLAGVNQTLERLLRLMGRLRRLGRRGYSLFREPVTFIHLGARDEKEIQEEIDGTGFTPIFYVVALILLLFGVWHFYDDMSWASRAPLKSIDNLVWWTKYPLVILYIGAASCLGLFVLILVYLLLTLITGGLAGCLIYSIILFLRVPAHLLLWVSKGKEREREKKIGWIGFFSIVLAFFIQAAVNLMP